MDFENKKEITNRIQFSRESQFQFFSKKVSINLQRFSKLQQKIPKVEVKAHEN